MLRKRLSIALAVLAVAALLEGMTALWALDVATRQVERGRVASDIQLGFVELSAQKQRLRTWVAQLQSDAKPDPDQRDRLLYDMGKTMSRLQLLSQQAIRLDDKAAAQAEHAQRQDALAILALSLGDLERTVGAARPLQPGTDARAAWQALSQLFEAPQGQDLRRLLSQSMERESAAVLRKRAAADETLSWVRSLWSAVAGTLALSALVLAAYFARALRRPLEQLSQGALALQQGDLGYRMAVDGDDEFAAVARSMNLMAAELSAHRQGETLARIRLEEVVGARTAELQSALETLQQVEARRRQLFADISHELRTPTTAIRGEAEIGLRGKDKEVAEYKLTLARIVETSTQLGLVIDDLLTMARSDIETLVLRRQTVDLTQPLAEALEQARALAHDTGVQVQSKATAGPLPVLGDPQRLRQLITILLDNAVRYSRPGGQVTASLSRSAGPGDEPQLELRVQDQGIGIAEADLPRLFERHFRGEHARRHRADGSGLGLAIAAALARAHGGQLHIDSRLGQGSAVTLRLPLAQELPT
jgi:two-component system, OmpR family, sensor kinase